MLIKEVCIMTENEETLKAIARQASKFVSQDYAERTVERFYANLQNTLEVMLQEKSIKETTTVGELLIIINKPPKV